MEKEKKERILLITRPICPPWDEGSKNFAFYLAKNIQEFEIGLLTNGIVADLPANVIQKPIYTSGNFSYLQKIRLMKHLRKLSGSFDIFHYLFTPTKQNTFLIKYFVNFGKKNRIKSIQTIATLREDLYSDEEIKKLMFANLIITYSEYAKNKLNSLGFQNVRRIYPGIDLEEYRKKEKNPELMKKYGFNSDDFVINFSGEYSRLRAIDGVVETFAKISQKISNAKLSLAVRIKNKEDEEKKKEIVEKLKKLGVLDKVVFHNDQKQAGYSMSDIYNLCDISIFPVQDMKGKFDVPLAVIEAMACEKPVIISDLPVLREFANSENSIKIKAGDWNELEKSILDLCGNQELRQKIGKSARAYAEKNFDIKNVAQEYEKIYGEI